MPRIQQDPVVQQVMETRGIDASTGVFGSHKVRFGNNPPISLAKIKSFRVPFQGFRHVTRVQRGRQGLGGAAENLARTLCDPARCTPEAVLKGLRTCLEYSQRLSALGSNRHPNANFLTVLAAVKARMNDGQVLAARNAMLSQQAQLIGLSLSREAAVGESAEVRTQMQAMLSFFNRAKAVFAGADGLAQDARNALSPLLEMGGLNARRLLRGIGDVDSAAARLAALGTLSRADRADNLKTYAPAVESLSNRELSTIWQRLNSAPMESLFTRLMTRPATADEKHAAEVLFDLQGLVLKEISNRSANGQIDDAVAREADRAEQLEARRPRTLSEQFGSQGHVDAREEGHDITSASLAVMAESSSRSATVRSNGASQRSQRIAARGLSLKPKAAGDLLRGCELTIGVKAQALFGENGIFRKPGEPKENAFHLAERGVKPYGDGYLDLRNQIEETYFEPFKGHDVRPDERPVYGALNLTGFKSGATASYGGCVLVLRKRTARQATYTARDTFMAAPLAVNANSRKAFFDLLESEWPGIASKYLDGEKDAAKRDEFLKIYEGFPTDRNHPERIRLEKLFAQFEASAVPVYSKELTVHLSAFGGDDVSNRLRALAARCFLQPEVASRQPVTYDNLESLLDQMDELEHGAILYGVQQQIESGNPMTGLGGSYIEAQIQGPLVPERDIAEIRIRPQELEQPYASQVGTEDFARQMAEFTRRTGIRVTILPPDGETDSQQSELNQNIRVFNVEHPEQARLEALESEALQSFGHRFALLARGQLGDAAFARIFPPGSDRLAALREDYRRTLKSELQNTAGSDFSSEERLSLADSNAMRIAVVQILDRLEATTKLGLPEGPKLAILEKMAFSREFSTLKDVRFLHSQAQALSETLRGLPGEASDVEVARRIAGFLRQTADDRRQFQGSEELVTRGPVLQSIAALAMQYLATDGMPPAERKAIAQAFASPQLRRDISMMHTASRRLPEAAARLHYLTGFSTVLEMFSRGLAKEAGGVPPTFVYDGVTDARLLPQPVLDIVEAEAPGTSELLAPLGRLQPAPAPAMPQALPQTQAQCRAFLVKALDAYSPHEQPGAFDAKRHVHGRGHVSRTYIFAAVLAGIMAEKGCGVDRSLLLCGIAAHDSAREANGNDVFEKQSAEKAVALMREAFGADSLGAAYEDAVRSAIITSQHKGEAFAGTLEAMLLHTADGLDIGRVQGVRPELNVFMNNSSGSKSSEALTLITRLYKEADILQKLTNPDCRLQDKITDLEGRRLEGLSDEEDERVKQQIAGLRSQIEREFADEAKVSSEDLFTRFEQTLRASRNLMPTLAKYYFAEEDAALDQAGEQVKAHLNERLEAKFPGLFPPGAPALVGNAKAAFEAAFNDSLARAKLDAKLDHSNPAAIAQQAFDKVVAALIEPKRELLEGVAKLPFANQGQRLEFRNWVLNARKIAGPGNLLLVYRYATGLSEQLRALAQRENFTDDDLLALLTRFLADCRPAVLAHVLEKTAGEVAADDDFTTEFVRIASCAYSLVSAGDPPVMPPERLQRLIDAMGSEGFRGHLGRLQGVDTLRLRAADSHDFDHFGNWLFYMANEFAARSGHHLEVQAEGVPGGLPEPVKAVLRRVAPQACGEIGI